MVRAPNRALVAKLLLLAGEGRQHQRFKMTSFS